MENLRIKTVGGAESEEMNFSKEQVANFYEEQCSGRKATEKQVESINQEFIDSNDIKAQFSSGSHLGFTSNDDILDAFEELPRY